MRISTINLSIIIAFVLLVIKTGGLLEDNGLIDTLLLPKLMAEEVAEQASSEAKQQTPSEEDESKTDPKDVSETPPEGYKSIKDLLNSGSNDFSDAEIKLLQNLAERRKKIEEWAESIFTREKVLKIAEQKIDMKLNELHSLKKEINSLLAEYEQKENEKISSLVKIYENMKPKEAAKIFEELDMEILLPVVLRMKEAKAASVFANMTPIKAKELTVEFANFKKLEKQKTETQIN